MTVARGLACLIALALPHAGLSQSAITGKVRDASEKPIPFCNVFVQRNGQLERLTQTDDLGAFVLTPLDTGKHLFAVTSIGYKKHEHQIILGTEPLTIDVVLSPDTVMLDQVIVHDKGAIQVKGDTVVYDASYFKTGEEVSLGDVLKKLPGVTVDESGRVKFQGKDVVKVKIEDDDLMDNNYQVLTKNLSADLVEQVEVLQNYSDNRLLKNIEDTEDVAINVTLKKDRKRQLFGDVRAEAGGEQYDARINVMSLAKKAKYYLLSTANNIGSDAGGEAEELMAYSTHLPGGNAEAAYVVPVDKPQIPQFKRERYYFNHVILGSLNAVFRPRKNLKVTLNGLGYRDDVDFSTASRSEYYTSLDTVGFDEFSKTTNRDLFGYLQAVVEYDVSANMNIRYRGHLDANDGAVPQQNSLNLNNVTRSLDFRSGRQDHLLTVTRKLSEKAACEFDFRYSYDVRPQSIRINGNLLADYFLPITTSDTLKQESSFASNLWIGQLTWFVRTSLGKVALKAGYEHIDQLLETSLTSPPSALASNIIDYRQGKTFVEGGYAMSFGRVVLTPVIAVQQVSTTLPDRAANSFLFFTPKLGLKWRLNDNSRFTAVYSFGQMTSSPMQLTRNPMLNDYNMIAVNDSGFRSFATRTLLVSYELGGWATGFSLFANLFHQESPSAYLTNTDIEPNYIVSTMDRFADRQLSTLSVSLGKYFSAIKSNLKFTWRGSRTSFVMSTESVAVPTTSFSHGLEGSLRTGLRGALNMHGGAAVEVSATSSNLIDVSNYNLLFFLDGYLNLLNQRLNITAHWERYELASVSGQPVFYFVDFSARFLLKREKGWALLLKGRNLMDENVFARRYVSSQSVETTANRLIPRYILAGVEFRF